MAKVENILDLPGDVEDENTEKGRFSSRLSDLISFKPGSRTWSMGGFKSLPENRPFNLTIGRLVTLERIQEVRKLLNISNIRY